MSNHVVVPTWLAVSLTVFSMVGTIFATWHNADKSTSDRLSALEAHEYDNQNRLDHIQVQLDKLVDWALGPTKR